MDRRIQRIKAQVSQPATDADIKAQMSQFLVAAEIESFQLQSALAELDAQRVKLAEFFCEDPATFKLEECFKVFHVFCERFRQAAADNERRRVQEEQLTVRRRHREEQQARSKARLMSEFAALQDFQSKTEFKFVSVLTAIINIFLLRMCQQPVWPGRPSPIRTTV